MKASVLTPDDPSWSRLLARAPHDFYHLPRYVQLEADRLRGDPLGVLVEHEERALFLPLVVRPLPAALGAAGAGWRDAVSPYGYPCPLVAGAPPHEKFVQHAAELLSEELALRRIVTAFVRLHPLIEMPLDETAVGASSHRSVVVTHGQTVWIDLAMADDEWRRELRPTTRNILNRMERGGLVPRLDRSSEGVAAFNGLYERMLDRVHATDEYRFGLPYFHRLRDAVGHDHWNLFLLDYEGAVRAGALFIDCGPTLQYHLAAADPTPGQLSFPALLLAHARRFGAERGLRRLHLGGGVGARADSLFLFKSGFSKLRATFATWRLVSHDGAFNALLRAWETLAGEPVPDGDGFFPSYRRPLGLG